MRFGGRISCGEASPHPRRHLRAGDRPARNDDGITAVIRVSPLSSSRRLLSQTIARSTVTPVIRGGYSGKREIRGRPLKGMSYAPEADARAIAAGSGPVRLPMFLWQRSPRCYPGCTGVGRPPARHHASGHDLVSTPIVLRRRARPKSVGRSLRAEVRER